MKFPRVAAAAAAFCLILPAASLVAQTFLFQSQAENRAQLGLRFMRPNFEGDSKLSTFSGTYDLWFNAPLGASRVNLVGAVPFNAFAVEGEDGESGIGNIYLGAQTRLGKSVDQDMNISLGVFLPTASDITALPPASRSTTPLFGPSCSAFSLFPKTLMSLTIVSPTPWLLARSSPRARCGRRYSTRCRWTPISKIFSTASSG